MVVCVAGYMLIWEVLTSCKYTYRHVTCVCPSPPLRPQLSHTGLRWERTRQRQVRQTPKVSHPTNQLLSCYSFYQSATRTQPISYPPPPHCTNQLLSSHQSAAILHFPFSEGRIKPQVNSPAPGTTCNCNHVLGNSRLRVVNLNAWPFELQRV